MGSICEVTSFIYFSKAVLFCSTVLDKSVVLFYYPYQVNKMLFCSAVLTVLTRKFHRLFSIFSYCNLWQNDCKLPHHDLLYVLEEVQGLEPGAPLPPPSPVTSVIAELLLSHILSLLFSS